MKVGFYHQPLSDCSLVSSLYPLANGQSTLLDGDPSEFSRPTAMSFIIELDGHTFHFANNLDKIKDCDIKIYTQDILFLNKDELNDLKDTIDYFIINRTNGENWTCPEIVLEYLKNEKVIVILGQDFEHSSEHPRLITDKALNLFFFYHRFGYYYLNYYPSYEKNHLIGAYNYNGKIYKTSRNKSLSYITDRIGNDMHIFETDKSFSTEVTGKLITTWAWQMMHCSSYTDYNSAVANIMFETEKNNDYENPNGTLTEKTLKSLLFQKAGIFFIYWGPYYHMEWLHEKGFWFLNSEFYDPDNLVNENQYNIFDSKNKRAIALDASVFKTVDYLAELKSQMGTNNEVYKFLIEKYQDKLNQTTTALEYVLKNCEWKNRLFDLIGLNEKKETNK